MYISADTADGEIFIYVQEYLEANAETAECKKLMQYLRHAFNCSNLSS